MEHIAHTEVVDYRKSIEKVLKNTLRQIDETMIEGRDEHNVPIYLTKIRVKSADSIYLKTKRNKLNDLSLITDYAGIRVLCLFEQDLYDVHLYIITSLKNNFELHNFRLFNWIDIREIETLIKALSEHYPDIVADVITKPSGYRSIHYIYEFEHRGKKHYVEIQLRTLLQDVWGELEHSLSYKQGNIHPHIKQSFVLLSNDLANSDRLLTHLKSISDKERVGNLYAREKAGPLKWFGYEDERIPKIFKTRQFTNRYKEYTAFMLSINPRADTSTNIKIQARRLYESLTGKIHAEQLKDPELNYFMKMEEAYLDFWDGEYEKTFINYQELDKKDNKHYILQFRIGEIHFIKGDTVKALVAFDACEELLGKYTSSNTVDIIELKFRLAYVYWLLGNEYIQFALDIWDEIKPIIEYLPPESRDKYVTRYVNNDCSYHLDKYLILREKYFVTKDQKDLNKAEEEFAVVKDKFGKLSQFVNDGTVTANMLDTAAWFLYNAYLKDRNPADLEKAKSYCKQIPDRENISTLKFISFNIHKNHIQEIMSAK